MYTEFPSLIGRLALLSSSTTGVVAYEAATVGKNMSYRAGTRLLFCFVFLHVLADGEVNPPPPLMEGAGETKRRVANSAGMDYRASSNRAEEMHNAR